MNKTKKVFCISDIHGHYTILKSALQNAGFDRKNPDHLLVCCGDYFDRGNENYNVLKFLDCIDNKILIRGNHEDMLLKIFNTAKLEEHNFHNGTDITIAELFGKYSIDAFGNIDFGGKTRILERITDFIMESVNFFETKNYVFVHGWLPIKVNEQKPYIDKDWRNASNEQWSNARWTKWTDMYLDCDRLEGKTIVCGHVPSFFANKFDSTRYADNADIFYGHKVIVVDAGTATSGQINVLMIEDELIV